MTESYFDKLTFRQEYRCFKKGEVLKFKPGINTLVGDQGSGKSTVLQLMRGLGGLKGLHDLSAEDAKKTVRLHRKGEKGRVRCVGWDFEKDNPRMKSYFDDNIGFQLQSKWMSHGQANRAVLDGLPMPKGSEIFVGLMDEPDSGLSLRSIFLLWNQFEKFVKNGSQLFVAVHHPTLIELAEEVYSLEHRKWMPSGEFIQSQDPVQPPQEAAHGHR
jgi:predicted ATPase